MRILLLVLPILLSSGWSRPAAADTAATCKGTIASVPTVITEQGTWCLTADVGTAIASGAAITVQTNNVTIDCNGYKIGGLAAGPSTETSGVLVNGYLNTVVRNCTLRGFRFGLAMVGGGGRLVERNRIEGSTLVGMFVQGDGSLLRDNQVIDTGPSTGHAWGIVTGGAVDVVGNTVSGVYPNAASGSFAGYGISIPGNSGSRVEGNILRAVGDGLAGSAAIFIATSSSDVVVKDNELLYSGGGSAFGLFCDGAGSQALATGNTMLRYAFPRYGCVDGGGNEAVLP
jgi:nitrous oxidase accessory protein NosD